MDVLCAAVSGVAARLVCHPLDTAKTVAFTGLSGSGPAAPPRPPQPPRPPRHSVAALWRREGLAGLYRGVGVAALGAGPGVALFLTAYAWARDGLGRLRGPGAAPAAWVDFASGFAAEAVSCVCWVPVDVTKERLRLQPSSLPGRYAGSGDALRTIVRYEGVRGLYRGYWSTLASFGPFSAVYFVFYEYLFAFFRERLDCEVFPSALFAGGIGNLAASLLTNPLEFIKTRLQVQRAVLAVDGRPVTVHGFHYHYTGLVDGIRSVLRDEGLRALWRGAGCRAAYTAPNAALTMSLYKWLQS